MKHTIAILSLAAVATGQVATTSPAGYSTKAGGGTAGFGYTSSMFFSNHGQLTQIDGTLRNASRSIKALHFRQAGVASASGAANSYQVQARIAHGDYAKVTEKTQKVDDLLVGKWTTAMRSRVIKFPDLRTAPTKVPAPWTVKLPFDAPFAYSGKNDLLFQVASTKAATGGQGWHVFDGIDGDRAAAKGSPYGSGCSYNGKEYQAETSLTVSRSRQRAEFTAMVFPDTNLAFGTGSVLALVGLRKLALDVGSCAKLLSSTEVILPMTSIAVRPGGVRGRGMRAKSFPYDANLAGKAELFVQVWGRTNQNSVVLSRGYRTGLYPKMPTPTQRVAAYTFPSFASGQFLPSVVMSKGSAGITGVE